MSVTVGERDAIGRVLRLMAIPGKSGQEGGVVAAIREELAQAGLPATALSTDQAHKKSPAGGEVGNLIVQLPGTQRGPRRLLMAHLDTVPLCVGSKPVLRGKVIRSADPKTALGGDDRGGASVLLTVLLEILRQKLPHPPLTFFWPVQEEIGLFGARLVKLSSLGNPKLCFNWDGGSARGACIGATGAYDLKIEVEGIASHAGVHPEGGVSAIGVAGLAIADLQSNGWHGLIQKPAPATAGEKSKRKGSAGSVATACGTGTSNIGIISGGAATNVVTPHVQLRAEVRSHDPLFRERLVMEFRQAFERAVQSVPNDAGRRGGLKFNADLKYESFLLKEGEASVQAALSAISAEGLEPDVRISNGGLDANWLSARGLPTVTMGCGQCDVHTVNETLKVDDYLHACRIGLRLATAM